jgi:PAS domain S-box-containing protein
MSRKHGQEIKRLSDPDSNELTPGPQAVQPHDLGMAVHKRPFSDVQFSSGSVDKGNPQQALVAARVAATKSLGIVRGRLKDSEARYRRLFETAQDGILILNAEKGAIIDVNPFLVDLLHYTREEFLGKELWEIGLFKDIEASKSAFRELQDKKYVRYEDLPLKTKAGESINVEFVSNVYSVNGKRVMQCNIRDITKRKHAEKSQHQLQQSQKMEAVGQLAGGVAHDFNNLLGVILGYCEILEKQTDLSNSARKMVVVIHNAGSSAKDLTRHLLAFSRHQVLQPIFLDLNLEVSVIEPMLNRLIGDDIELVSALSDSLGTIKADPNQIAQVLMNLVVNARDAMVAGGKIIIGTANQEVDHAYTLDHPSTRTGSFVVLSVTDTGCGMDEETQSRIFEPFYTTKGEGKGTGLGLSTVFGIVKQSGGFISVSSAPTFGAVFKIYLPRVENTAIALPTSKEEVVRGGTETILLVDDSGPLRELTRLLLEGCGYTVLDSGDPAEALRMATNHPGVLSLMITDVRMPGLSGPSLAGQLALTRPGTKILYMSGSIDDADLANNMAQKAYGFIEKPFTRDDFMRKIRETLDVQQPLLS